MPAVAPQIGIRPDDKLVLDGEPFDVLGLAAHSRDVYVVEDGDGDEHEWHVDEFSRRVRLADEISLVRSDARNFGEVES